MEHELHQTISYCKESGLSDATAGQCASPAWNPSSVSSGPRTGFSLNSLMVGQEEGREGGRKEGRSEGWPCLTSAAVVKP